MSHAPFWDSRDFDATGGAFMTAAAEARTRAEAAAPDVVVVVGPDHFRNFFYDAMPPFCIGLDRVSSFGDFRTPAGELPAASGAARAIHRSLQSAGFDLGVSLHMGVDHGIVQSYACLFPKLDVPLVPIMVACTGAAMSSLARCRALGAALGAAIRRRPGRERVLMIGSGGLSHWLPPTDPDHPAIAAELRDFVIDGRPIARDFQQAREQRLLAAAATMSGRVNDEWDRSLLAAFAAGDLDRIASMTDAEIDEYGGNGGHEIRNWLIAAAAWGRPIELLGYEPRSDWLTGVAVSASFS